MNRLIRVAWLVAVAALSMRPQVDLPQLRHEQERQDRRIERLEQQVATNTGYLNELKEARLRERVARMESANDLVIKLLLAIFTTVVAAAAYQVRRFAQMKEHLAELGRVTGLIHQFKMRLEHLACVQTGMACDPTDVKPEDAG